MTDTTPMTAVDKAYTLNDLLSCGRWNWLFFADGDTLFYAQLLASNEIDPGWFDRLAANNELTAKNIDSHVSYSYYWGELNPVTPESLLDFLSQTGQWYEGREESLPIAREFLNNPELWDRQLIYPVSTYKPIECL